MASDNWPTQSSGASNLRGGGGGSHPSESVSKAIAQYTVDARLHAIFEQSGESSKSFDYSQSVCTATPSQSVPEQQITAYLSKIQRGGHIQPFGATLTVDEPSFHLLAFSENAPDLLNLPQSVPSLDRSSPQCRLALSSDVRSLFTPSSALLDRVASAPCGMTSSKFVLKEGTRHYALSTTLAEHPAISYPEGSGNPSSITMKAWATAVPSPCRARAWHGGRGKAPILPYYPMQHPTGSHLGGSYLLSHITVWARTPAGPAAYVCVRLHALQPSPVRPCAPRGLRLPTRPTAYIRLRAPQPTSAYVPRNLRPHALVHPAASAHARLRAPQSGMPKGQATKL